MDASLAQRWCYSAVSAIPTLQRSCELTHKCSPYHFEGEKLNHNSTQIHAWSTPVRSDLRLRSVALPETAHAGNRVHIFALSVTPSLLSPMPDADKPILVVRRVRFTTKRSKDGFQIVEVALANLLPEGDDGWLLSPRAVTIDSPVVRTVRAGRVNRLMAGDEVRVEVLVAPKKGVTHGSTGRATIELRDLHDNVIEVSKGWAAKVPDKKWTVDQKSSGAARGPELGDVLSWPSRFRPNNCGSGVTRSSASCKFERVDYIHRLNMHSQHSLGSFQRACLGTSWRVCRMVFVSNV